MTATKVGTCYNCAERRVTEEYNCHSHCEKYSKFKEEINAKNESERFATKKFITGNKRKRKIWKPRVEDSYNV